MRDDPYSLNTFTDNDLNSVNRPDAPWSKFLAITRHISNDKDYVPGKASRDVLLDMNCWLLLFHGYTENQDKRFGIRIIEEEGIQVSVNEDLLAKNVKLLFTIFHFNLRSFYEVWTYQHDIVRLLHQIVREDFFIGNRFARRQKRQWKPQYELVCSPTRYNDIPLPRRHRVLDGLLFPVIVSLNKGPYRVERLEVANFGDGDFITCDGEIIDCIRVNDFWQTRNHLKQRLAFSFLVQTDYDEAPMIVCNNMRDIEEAWRLLGADESSGVLIRSLGENLYENYWLVLNKDSAFVGSYTKTGYSLSKRSQNKRGFVTLEGRHVGNLGYTYTALKNMAWLDAFDIERFSRIVFQENDHQIKDDILKENNRYDMRPEFDFGLFDLEELEKLNDDYDY